MSMTENEKLQKAIEEEKELYEIMKDRYEKLGLESCKDRAEEHELNIKWLEEIQQYRAIGTVEEFKALKEKNEPKRLLTKWEMYPTNHGVYSSADRWCPSCKNLVFDGDWSVSKQKMMYNRHRCKCGQVLDWR